MDNRPETPEEWEKLLASEGMPATLPVSRMRLDRKWRKPGTDLQPRREVALSAAWAETTKPQTETEWLMQPGDQPPDRITELIENLPQHLEQDLATDVVAHLVDGCSVREIAEILGYPVIEVEVYVDAMREAMATWL